MIHMSPKKTKNPEWETIAIIANQNFFIRSVIMAIVSQILLGIFSVFMFYVFAFVIGGISANNSTALATFPANLVLFLLVLCVANLIFFIYNLAKISDLHKKVSGVEDAILEDQE